MDHLVKVFLGTILSFGALLFFYSLFDRLLRSLRAANVTSSKSRSSPIPLLLSRPRSGFVYEEYASAEPLAILLSNQSSSIGICLLPASQSIQYFLYEGPTTLNDFLGVLRDPSSLAHVLLEDRETVRALNNAPKSLGDSGLQFHWTENWFCADGFYEELWEELIVLGRALRAHGDREALWRDFVVGHWRRERLVMPFEANLPPLIDLS